MALDSDLIWREAAVLCAVAAEGSKRPAGESKYEGYALQHAERRHLRNNQSERRARPASSVTVEVENLSNLLIMTF